MKMKSDLLAKCVLLYGLFLGPALSLTTVTVKNMNLNGRAKRDAGITAEHHHAHHEKFLIPKPLKHQDKITVNGTMFSNTKWITVSLVLLNDTIMDTDETNVACQVNASISDDHTTLHTVVDGKEENRRRQDLSFKHKYSKGELSDLYFTISFTINAEDSEEIRVAVDDEDLDETCIKHDDHSLENIRYLTLGGHWNKEKGIDLVFTLP